MEKKYGLEECQTKYMETLPCQECLDTMSLAMAYIPWQKWKKVYTNDVGFTRGTLFSDLDLPFLGEEVMG